MKLHPLEKQILKQPKNVMFCKKCVMSNQRPRITFDDNGVCGGCRNNEFYKKNINWSEREKELRELLDQNRSKEGKWDVVVPSSGGKDSAFVAHQLKYKYGMNPLTVTWTPLIYTNIGWKNFQSLRDVGFTNILCSPNGILHRQLARLSFEEFGDAFHIFVLGQYSYAFHMAVKFNIKLVMFGENGEAEYAGVPSTIDKPFIPAENFNNLYFKGTSIDELVDYGIKNKKYFDKDINKSDLDFYKPPLLDDLKKAGIKGKHFFGYYKKWTPQDNYFYAAEHTGFEPNPEVFKLLEKKFENSNVRVFNYGISDETKTVIFNKNLESSSSSINKLNLNSKYYKKKFLLLNFFNTQNVITEINVQVRRLDEFLERSRIEKIDLLKIDTEGYEFTVLKSLGHYITKINMIHFEHHFDDMIIKNYKLSDIHKLLTHNGFEKYFKIKMKFRKSFEYIYVNKKF